MIRCPPAFSVVIPAHNSSAVLPETLDSVRAQTFQDLEVIVSDDASTDETWKAVEEYAVQFPGCYRSIRIAPPSKGPAAARNAAIRLARGKFVAFLDSDDLWVPEHLARAAEVFQRHGDSVGLFAGPGQILGTTRLLHEFAWPTPDPQPAAADLLQYCYFPLPSVCVRRHLVEQVGGFSEELVCHEDWLLYLQLSKRTLFVHSPAVECLIRRRPQSVSTFHRRMSKAMYRDRVKAYLIAERTGLWTASDLRVMREAFIEDRANELADYLCGFDLDSARWEVGALLQSGLPGRRVWLPILRRGFHRFLARGLRKANRSLSGLDRGV